MRLFATSATLLVLFETLTCGCTRLNSTLSARIEELNAQISTLYVENLRLRASEIALTSQLKKEREKSRKILADAETAVSTNMFCSPSKYPELRPNASSDQVSCVLRST